MVFSLLRKEREVDGRVAGSEKMCLYVLMIEELLACF